MKQYKRSVRLGEQILRDLPAAIGGTLNDKFSGMVTFTKVQVSGDLRYATVYYSYLGNDSHRSAVDEYLKRETGRIRKLVGGPMRIRHIPEFRFKYDTSIEYGLRIEQLLNEIKSDLHD